MASKSGQPQKVESPEELLEIAGQALDRLRVMYEQYFLGMQKQAPGVLHSEVERRLRDLQQANLRNTKMRYQFATMQQKFGSYNAYWKRTLRQIENGTYMRSLAKIGRNAALTGKEIPEEILAAMPKMMREQVQRDRALALAKAQRQKKGKAGDAAAESPDTGDDLLDLGLGLGSSDDVLGPEHYEAPMELPPEELADVVAMINEPSELRRNLRKHHGPHVLQESDGELDIDSFFAAVEAEGPAAAQPTRPPARGVNFRSVTRSSAELVAPPEPEVMTLQGAQPLPAQRPSQPMPSQAPPRPSRPSQQMQAAMPAQTSPSGQRPSQPMPSQAPPRPSQQMQAQPPQRQSQPMPAQPPQRPSQPMPAQRQSQPMPVQPPPSQRPSQPLQAQTSPSQRPSQPIAAVTPPVSLAQQTSPSRPAVPPVPAPPRRMPTVPPPIPIPSIAKPAPSQAVKPNPIAPGAAASAKLPVPVPAQPMPRAPQPTPPAAARATPPPARPRSDTDPEPPRGAPPPARRGPPPGMTDADVNALHAKYIKAKEMVGQEAGPGSRDKLLKTINDQAPKIMEQYKAKGVDFQVVVKDNQVIIRAKPKP